MSSHYSASFSLTLRVRLDDRPARSPTSRGRSPTPAACSTRSTSSASRPGARSATSPSCDRRGHADAIVVACRGVDGIEVENVSDRTFLMHLGGKIHMDSNVTA